MNTKVPEKQSTGKSEVARGIRKRMVQVVATFFFLSAVLFISAGTLDWAMAWAYLGAYLGVLAVNAFVVLPRQPEMVAERSQIKEDVKRWDRILGILIGIPTLAMLTVAGLDKRFEWSSESPLPIHLVTLALVVLGQGLFSWAMQPNKFFSRAVRIQMDRGHSLETGGPYRYVRHPGYVGLLISLLAAPLVLGSLWALIPAGFATGGYLIRTALEDRTLQGELEGYKDYAQKVSYRLLPGV